MILHESRKLNVVLNAKGGSMLATVAVCNH